MIQQLKRLSPIHDVDEVQLENKIQQHNFIQNNNLKIEK